MRLPPLSALRLFGGGRCGRASCGSFTRSVGRTMVWKSGSKRVVVLLFNKSLLGGSVKVTNLPYLEGSCYVTNLPIEDHVLRSFIFIFTFFFTFFYICNPSPALGMRRRGSGLARMLSES
jgi:hypothetical protein